MHAGKITEDGCGAQKVGNPFLGKHGNGYAGFLDFGGDLRRRTWSNLARPPVFFIYAHPLSKPFVHQGMLRVH